MAFAKSHDWRAWGTMMRVAFAAVLSTLAFLACDPTVDSPCDSDPTGCSTSTSGFVTLANCPSGGSLQVVIGQGQSDFTALEPGQAPQVHYGPQGGQHTFLALRVVAKDAALTPMLLVHATVSHATLGIASDRKTVLGQKTPLVPVTSGDTQTVEVHGITMFLDQWIETESRTIHVEVTDQCSRHAVADQVIPRVVAPK